ncbi:MAG: pilin [bacterium]|nr:pilin [bacterium]
MKSVGNKKANVLKFVCLVFIAMIFILPYFISAQGLVPCGSAGQDPCTICDFSVLLKNIIDFLIWNIAIPLAGLMIVVGGIMIMIGSASETRVAAGKKVLTNALIGIVIVFVAWLFVDTVIKVLTGSFSRQSFFSIALPWNRIPPGACKFW